uniref:Uncharacterized protein n=1 Tax=Anopheles minimus TaxID=112268 RepID=A0A182WHG3_9DIPT
ICVNCATVCFCRARIFLLAGLWWTFNIQEESEQARPVKGRRAKHIHRVVRVGRVSFRSFLKIAFSKASLVFRPRRGPRERAAKQIGIDDPGRQSSPSLISVHFHVFPSGGPSGCTRAATACPAPCNRVLWTPESANSMLPSRIGSLTIMGH